MRLKTALISIAALITVSASPMCAQSLKERQARKSRLEKEIAILDRQIKENASKNASAMSRLSLIENKVATRQELVNESDAEISDIDARISSRQHAIDSLSARLDTMTVYYDRLVMNAYKNRDARVWYMYILASDNLAQGMRRFAYLRNLSSQLNAQAAVIKSSRDEIVAQKAELDSLRNGAQELRSKRVKDLETLKSEEQDVRNLSARLKKEKSKYQKDLAAKKQQSDALEREIRKMIASAKGGDSSRKNSKSGTSKPKAPVDYKLSTEFASNKGKLPWPAKGPLTGRFGKQYHSVYKSLQLPQNNGVSIAVSPDSEVKAVFNGTVVQISVLPGYHQCILIQHGGYFTLYSKMKNVYVKAGDKVKTEQALGTVDTIDGETVFHFEIWDDNTVPQNPESWLRPR
ncbi:MAG: peptidoglycan DD-metalloendopeptidase family protein [Bacteroidales bacterium]|nr:peptidoglycan DD-metalloendopeptidase family protein [Candidatus Cryptobacteroides onthequi]